MHHPLTSSLYRVSLALTLALVGVAPAAAQDNAPPKRASTETSRGKFDPSQIDVKKALWVSPDGRRVAWLTKDEKGIVIDGKLTEHEYPRRTRYFAFSPDSQRTAYVTLVKDKQETLILDGVESAKGYNTISNPGPVFSPDSKHVAHLARLWASEYATAVVIDGKEYAPNKDSGAWNLTFTADNRRVVYGDAVDKKYRMRELSVDGSEPTVEHAHGPALLTIPFLRGAGGQLGYVAKDDKGQFLFYDGKDDKHRFKEIERDEIAVSPDGKRVIYAGEPESFRKVVVIDGVKSKVFSDLAKKSLVFSPDSKRVAYCIRDFSKFTPVIDGQEGKVYAGVDGIVFSPDSKRVAYRAVTQKVMTVVDGKEGAGYDAMGLPVFSPDSKQVAVAVKLGKREFLLINGQPDKKAYDEIGEPVYSPDGKRLVYQASTGGKWFLVDSGKELKPYDVIAEEMYFSPDGKYLATVVGEGGKQKVVVNGVEGAPYDTIFLLAGAKPTFSGDGKLHYLATKAGELLLVEESLE